MTLACTSLCNETCPSAVSEVTFVTNSFNLGAGDVSWVHTALTFGQLTNPTTITIPSLPAANTLKLYKNGQQIDDYDITNLVITLDVAATADDVFVYDYLPQPE